MKETLKEKTAKGLLWGAINNGAQQCLNMLFGICLARLLSPGDYGLIGMLTVFSQIATAIQESGFTSALVNKQHIRHEDYNAVFWFSVLCGGALYLLLFFSAPFIADYYHQPKLTALSRYCFLGFLISSTGIAHNACLFRNLKVKQNAIIGMVSLTASGVVGVILAFCGMAYWGLATQGLVFVVCTTAGRWYFSGWNPTWHIDLRPVKSMFGFGSKILLTNIVTIVNNNILAVILGRYYTEREVGYYNQANKWNTMGYSTIQGMINGVAQPVLHNVEEDDGRQVRVFRKMLRFTSFLSFPCMFGLALIAPELIVITVTDKWLKSAELMQVICIGGAVLPLQNLYYNLLLSKRRSDLCLRSTICFCLVQIGVIVCCRDWGLDVMVKAYVLVNILWMFVWHFCVRKEMRLSLWQALKDVLPFAGIAAVCMLAAGFAASVTENVFASVAIKIVSAAVLYTLIMMLSGSVTFKECKSYIIERIRRK